MNTTTIGPFNTQVLERIDSVRQPYGRHAKKLTDGELGTVLCTSTHRVDIWTRFLDGERELSSLDLALLAQKLEVSVYWLLTGEPDPFEVKLTTGCQHPYND